MQERPGVYRRITKEEINELPVRQYTGPVHVVRDKRALAEALDGLAGERVLGFDTETRPAFKKGVNNPPALLQLAGTDGVYLFQLGVLGFPPSLRRVLADAQRIKSGVALGYDILKLQELAMFKPAAFVELGDLARRAGLKNYGLRGLAAALLGVRISKRARMSNWSRDQLNDEQIAYAATDAWISRELYLRLEPTGHGEGHGA